MSEFISSNWGSGLVLLIITATVVFLIGNMIKSHKNAKKNGGCGGSCTGCACGTECHHDKK